MEVHTVDRFSHNHAIDDPCRKNGKILAEFRIVRDPVRKIGQQILRSAALDQVRAEQDGDGNVIVVDRVFDSADADNCRGPAAALYEDFNGAGNGGLDFSAIIKML